MTATVTDLAPLSGPGLTASVAAQLRAAADLIESVPGLKVSPFAGSVIHYFAATTGEVDEMAGLLGKKARWEGNHYSVKWSFGSEVTYSALHICKATCRPPVSAHRDGAGTGTAA